jgi:DNA-binding beta-propeller fold protein YncE
VMHRGDSAEQESDPKERCARRRASRRVGLAVRRSMLPLCVIAGGVLLSSAPALAAEVHHHLDHTLSVGLAGKCLVSEPGGVAVNNSTGDVYVVDKLKHRIVRLSSSGACIGSFGGASPEAIAIDNSGGPSEGDLYVSVNSEVGSEEHTAVNKYDAEGKLLKRIKRFQTTFEVTPFEHEEFAEHGEIMGVAVDAKGGLWVYDSEVIYGFNNEEKNVYQTQIAVSGSCSPRPGFAVSPDAKFFYVGRERESRTGECEEPTALMELGSSGEPLAEGEPFTSQLDRQNTTGATVDNATGIVYFDNAKTVAAFGADGRFDERFGDEATPGPALQEGTGVAVNGATNEVFVADNATQKINVYTPGPEAPPAKGEPLPPLPDNRAWELVSPENKHGSEIFSISTGLGLVQAAADGSAITYTSSAPVVANPPSNRSPEPSVSLSRRGEGAWSTQDLGTPRAKPLAYHAGNGTEYRFFSSDLSHAFVEPAMGIYEPHEPPLSPGASETTQYRRDTTLPNGECEPTPSGCYVALVSPLDTAAEGFGVLTAFVDATPDAGHAVLRAKVKLTADPLPGEASAVEPLYEWQAGATEAGGSLQLVSVPPAGEESGGINAKLGERGEREAENSNMRHAISNNGSRVIWTGGEGQLYLRDMVKHETLRIDTPEEGMPPPPEAAAVFAIADSEGTRIFFTDGQRLTKDSTAEEGLEPPEGQADLYVCEVVEHAGKLACELKNLTAGVAAPDESASVQGVLGASEDGSYVYFVADGALAAHAGTGHCATRTTQEEREEREGKLPLASCNLYVEHRGAGGWEPAKFIAALTNEDGNDWRTFDVFRGLTSRVSENGEHLAFMSNRSFTGYNNVDVHPEAGGARDEEVFLYNWETDRVLCASCNPKKARPSGVFDTSASGEGAGLLIDRGKLWDSRWLAANLPAWTPHANEYGLYLSRNLSNGGRLFFNSVDPLVPAAENGKADVYEYEPQGEGTCTSETGCISLVSSGTSSNESAFLDASTNGSDVFILTSAKLTSQDQDAAFDIYDAHVCTSASPCLTPPVKEVSECASKPSEAACRTPSSVEPALPSVPPSALAGPGNAGTVVVLHEKVQLKPKPKLTNAQLLSKALKACKKKKNKKKRAACVKQAKKRYPLKKGKAGKAALKRGKR